jgi:hypothetical protein
MRKNIIDTAFSRVETATARQIAAICRTTKLSARHAVHNAKKSGKIVEVGRETRVGQHGQPAIVYRLNPNYVRKAKTANEAASGTGSNKAPLADLPERLFEKAMASRSALEVAWGAR